MATPEMEKTIAKLRFLLADIEAKEGELAALIRQFKRQMQQAVTYATRESSLDVSLAAMSEVQERLNDAQVTQDHLKAIRVRTEADLEALNLTRQVEKAKADLASLEAGQTLGKETEEARQEIQELERFIEEASLRASEAITGKGQ